MTHRFKVKTNHLILYSSLLTTSGCFTREGCTERDGCACTYIWKSIWCIGRDSTPVENQTPKSKSLQFRTRTNNSYTLSILAKCTVGSSWWVNSRGRLMCRNLRVVLFLSTVLSAISDSVFKSVSLRSKFSNAVFTYIIKKIGHAYNIPTMQFQTVIPRNTQSRSSYAFTG